MLVTPRLELKPAGPHLFDQQWEAVQASLPELRVWMPWAIEADPQGTLTYQERAKNEWDNGRERHFVIFDSGRAAGACSLDRVDDLNLNCEIGYWMRSDLCGKGLMTEAASAVVTFGFETEGFHRIELNAGTRNAASNRIAEKLGFKREGVSRESGRGAAGFHDVYVYGLLETDPRPNFHLKTS